MRSAALCRLAPHRAAPEGRPSFGVQSARRPGRGQASLCLGSPPCSGFSKIPPPPPPQQPTAKDPARRVHLPPHRARAVCQPALRGGPRARPPDERRRGQGGAGPLRRGARRLRATGPVQVGAGLPRARPCSPRLACFGLSVDKHLPARAAPAAALFGEALPASKQPSTPLGAALETTPERHHPP